MATQDLTIPKQAALDASEDYVLLRREGLSYIERLAGKVWTDYNTHDPGITTMELLCYAITDLAYRTSFSIPDLLAANPEDASAPDPKKTFFSANEILPVNPVSETDLRKLIIDVPGVKNCWVESATHAEVDVFAADGKTLRYSHDSGFERLPLNGLYNVLLEFEPQADGKEESELTETEARIRREEKERTRIAVRQRVMAHRSLCEDLMGISEVAFDDIAVCADVELRQNADINIVQAKIFYILENYFSPQLTFYTLEEMLDRGHAMEEVFEGPLLTYGFLESEEVEKSSLKTDIRTSDLINSILDIEDVVSVKSFKLIKYVEGEPVEGQDWELSASPPRAVRLTRSHSKFIFYKGVLPYMAHADQVLSQLNILRQSGKKFRKIGHNNNVEIPEGRFRDLTQYRPVQYDYPMVYGIGEVGVSNSASPERQAQAKQMKAYLLMFEQVLTNYLAQLSTTGKLFSAYRSVDRKSLTISGSTYASQPVEFVNDLFIEIEAETDPDKKNKLLSDVLMRFDNSSDYRRELQEMSETKETFANRRNRFLNHLLARFCEDMTEYSLLLFQRYGKMNGSLRLIADKEALFNDYPLASRDRGKAFNYKGGNNGIWDTTNVSGLKVRIARLLGMPGQALGHEDGSVLRIIRHKSGTKRWQLQLLGEDDTVLMQSKRLKTEADARILRDEVVHCGAIVDCYQRGKSGNEYYFYLYDRSVSASELMYSNEYEKVDKVVGDETIEVPPANYETDIAKALELISRLNDSDTIVRRTIAPANIKINKIIIPRIEDLTEDLYDDETGNAELILDDEELSTKLWHVTISDPKDENKYYLQTWPTADETCAESQRLFMLHAADDEERYQINHVTISDSEGGQQYGWRYVFYDDCNTAVAYGPTFTYTPTAVELLELKPESELTSDELTQVLNARLAAETANPYDYDLKTEKYRRQDECRYLLASLLHLLGETFDIEDFHLVEHILLRPRTVYDPLLPVCSELEVLTDEIVATNGRTPQYRFVRDLIPSAKSGPIKKTTTPFSPFLHTTVVTQPAFTETAPRTIASLFETPEGPSTLIPESTPILTETVEEPTPTVSISSPFRIALIEYDASGGESILLQLPKRNSGKKRKYQYIVLEDRTDATKYADMIVLRGPVYSEGKDPIADCIHAIGTLRYAASQRENFVFDTASEKAYLYAVKRDDDGQLVNIGELVSVQSKNDLRTAEEFNQQLIDRLSAWFRFEFSDEKETAVNACNPLEDPYSFRLSIVLPSWPARFRNPYYRQYVERVIRQESPAHIFPRICWVGFDDMRDFETSYKNWIAELEQYDVPDPNIVGDFIQQLYTIRNVYPTAILHSCDDISGDEPQAILDNTTLGSL